MYNERALEENVLVPRKRGSDPNKNAIKGGERNINSTNNNLSRKSDFSANDKKPLTKSDIAEYIKQEAEADRKWYETEEGLIPDEKFESLFIGDQSEFAAFEDDVEKMNRAKKMGKPFQRRKSQKAQALEKDQNSWEQNRIESAGFGNSDRVEIADDINEDNGINLLVLDTKPSFLVGEQDLNASTQIFASVTKDPNSDLAIIAKKGSALLNEIRKRKESLATQNRVWDLRGTKQGDLIGVDDDLNPGLKPDPELPYDYKASSSYSKLRAQQTPQASAFSRQKSLKQQREFLPIFSVRAELMRAIRDNQVVIVVGETGSGKTTQLTQYLLDEGLAEHGLIGCTQPRRVAAMSVAKRVAQERGCALGEEVGYAIRFEDCTSRATRIKYLTDGVLLRESLRSADLEEYAVVVMDEAHERSLHTDILFGLLKDVCRRRGDLKLVVTSATLDSKKFSSFFGGAPVFEVPGRTFPVDVIFSSAACEDYLESVVKQLLTIHLTHAEGDILVFMTGQEDIEALCSEAARRLEKVGAGTPLLFLPIYSALPSEQQARVFEAAPPGTRKCVVATNIAETSITLDGIKYVVDGGFCKLKVYNPRVGMDSLQVAPISKANANQRSGRAGRTAAGTAYRMYTLRAYNTEMLNTTVPEIQRTNLGNVVLLLKSLGVQDLLSFDFMDPPSKENILNAMYQLWVLGALGDFGEMTALGRHMAEFPLDPPLSKMLVFSAFLGCSAEILTIVSVLSVPSIFYRPNDHAAESDAAREKFTVPESDHLTLMRVYETWISKGYGEKWCQEHFVHYKAMKRVREVQSQLTDIMKQRGLPIVSCEFDYDRVRKCICSAYFHNSAKMKGIGEYANLRSRMPCHLHPSSGLYGLGFTPEFVVYHELIFTSREYMRTVTAVDPRWLAELGPMLFAKRENRKTSKSLLAAQKSDKIVFQRTAMLEGDDAAGTVTKAVEKEDKVLSRVMTSAEVADILKNREENAVSNPKIGYKDAMDTTEKGSNLKERRKRRKRVAI